MDTLSPEALRSATLVDGAPSESLPCSDRGLAYGDGLFETLALIEGIPRHWQRHMARLREGAERLGIPCADEGTWQQDLARLLPDRPPGRAVLKIILTRGSGRRGYAPETGRPSRRILQFSPWPEGAGETLARVVQCNTPLARSPLLAGLKHLNRLEQVLAADEVARAGAQEGLMFDTCGELIAGTRGNVFLLRDGILRTPPLLQSGVRGIMREVLLETGSEAGFPVVVEALTAADLARCEGLALTNSLRGVQVVEELELPTGMRHLEVAALLALRDDLRLRQLAP